MFRNRESVQESLLPEYRLFNKHANGKQNYDHI